MWGEKWQDSTSGVLFASKIFCIFFLQLVWSDSVANSQSSAEPAVPSEVPRSMTGRESLAMGLCWRRARQWRWVGEHDLELRAVIDVEWEGITLVSE